MSTSGETGATPAAPVPDADLQPLFAPRSIAVIGASAAPGKAGHALMRSLATLAGPLYPINPRSGNGHPDRVRHRRTARDTHLNH